MSDTLWTSEDGEYTVGRHCGPTRKDGKERRMITLYYRSGDDDFRMPIDVAKEVALAILKEL